MLSIVSAVARALIANFVLVPILALTVGHLMSLDEPLRVGLVLLGMAAGAPFLIKLTEAADHDVCQAASLLILLLPITIVYLPAIVPLIASSVTVDAVKPAAGGVTASNSIYSDANCGCSQAPNGRPAQQRCSGSRHGCLGRLTMAV